MVELAIATPVVLAMLLGLLFRHEKVSKLTWLGAGLILVGARLTLPTVQEALKRMFSGGAP